MQQLFPDYKYHLNQHKNNKNPWIEERIYSCGFEINYIEVEPKNIITISQSRENYCRKMLGWKSKSKSEGVGMGEACSRIRVGGLTIWLWSFDIKQFIRSINSTRIEYKWNIHKYITTKVKIWAIILEDINYFSLKKVPWSVKNY